MVKKELPCDRSQGTSSKYISSDKAQESNMSKRSGYNSGYSKGKHKELKANQLSISPIYWPETNMNINFAYTKEKKEKKNPYRKMASLLLSSSLLLL